MSKKQKRTQKSKGQENEKLNKWRKKHLAITKCLEEEGYDIAEFKRMINNTYNALHKHDAKRYNKINENYKSIIENYDVTRKEALDKVIPNYCTKIIEDIRNTSLLQLTFLICGFPAVVIITQYGSTDLQEKERFLKSNFILSVYEFR